MPATHVTRTRAHCQISDSSAHHARSRAARALRSRERSGCCRPRRWNPPPWSPRPSPKGPSVPCHRRRCQTQNRSSTPGWPPSVATALAASSQSAFAAVCAEPVGAPPAIDDAPDLGSSGVHHVQGKSVYADNRTAGIAALVLSSAQSPVHRPEPCGFDSPARSAPHVVACRPVVPRDPAPRIRNATATSQHAYHFFAAISFITSISRSRSATSFFSRAFSCSSTFSRRTSLTWNVPKRFFHVEIVCSLVACRFAVIATPSRSASRRIATICSSVNRDLRMLPSESEGSLSTNLWSENPGAGHGIDFLRLVHSIFYAEQLRVFDE